MSLCTTENIPEEDSHTAIVCALFPSGFKLAQLEDVAYFAVNLPMNTISCGKGIWCHTPGITRRILLRPGGGGRGCRSVHGYGASWAENTVQRPPAGQAAKQYWSLRKGRGVSRSEICWVWAPCNVCVTQMDEELDFEKEPFHVPEELGCSGIAEMVANCQSYRTRMQSLRVFLPVVDPVDESCRLHKLHVAVPETARAPDVIVLALQQIQREQISVPPEQRLTYHTNPNFYRLRVAEVWTGSWVSWEPEAWGSTLISRPLRSPGASGDCLTIVSS